MTTGEVDRAPHRDTGSEVLRRAFSCYPSGVAALCADVGGEPAGMGHELVHLGLAGPSAGVGLSRYCG